ncbi:DUF4097 family beta strand repeat-containing protein [Amycolatopsis jejuensis]|uniref:DUF4097 family beta strand repeat-containing protein n=1 Tax=Amycolatopsis jejuensis TaxID=330084 RepID=UPI000525CC7E|nr:DUF4097 family beta strand repeat-containing protein [Amycolatopsis jejuensis]
MPNFETSEPISATVELGAGRVRIVAGDRTDTVVEVRPSDESDESDVKAAQQVRVDYTNGTLHVIGPRQRAFDFSRKTRSVDVSISLPAGSRVSGDLQAGDFRSEGRLGDSQFKTSAGNVRLARTGTLRVDTSAGHITADTVAGSADISTGSGKVRLGEVEGTVVVKNSNGDTTVDAATGDVRVRSANGDITVGRAGAGVDAKSSNGAIRVGEVVRGSVVLATSMGDLNVGIAEGTAAWLEVNTSFGHVHNQLDTAGSPGASDETVEVRGRTSYGDITIHRS